jgi:hypothetical protein
MTPPATGAAIRFNASAPAPLDRCELYSHFLFLQPLYVRRKTASSDPSFEKKAGALIFHLLYLQHLNVTQPGAFCGGTRLA